ncbi:hypothetical protein G9P44_004963 [Scheffersomyces stipitis]|nr:hypothetical protein G9P44_004963 [Scheffersomyces stipitis]
MSYHNSGGHRPRGGYQGSSYRGSGGQQSGSGGYNRYNNNNGSNSYGGRDSYISSGHNGSSNYNGSNNYNGGSSYSSNVGDSSNNGNGFQRRPFKRNAYQAAYQSQSQTSSSQSQPHNAYNQQGNRYNDTQFQIWMGGLDPTWTEESIANIWQTVGVPPVSVKIMRDKFNTTKPPYSFVTFANEKEVDTAVQKNGLVIPGSARTFKINYAGGPKSEGHGGATSGSSRYPDSSNSRQIAPKNEHSIFIGDLALDVTEDLIFAKFNTQFPGQVKQVKIMFDQQTGANKGFGFVRFTNIEIKNRALKEMNGVVVGSRAIRVGQASGSNSGGFSSPAPESENHEISRVHLSQSQPALNQFTDPNNTTLSITGLSSKFTEDELALHFIAFGDIVACKLSDDLQSASIKFFSRSAAEWAVLFLHGAIINDCNISITWGKDSSTTYKAAIKPPLTYGSFDINTLRLDNFSKQELSELFTVEVNGNSPLPASNINELHVKSKLANHNLLESALY